MGPRNQLASEPRANLLFQEVKAIETDAKRFCPKMRQKPGRRRAFVAGLQHFWS